MSIPKITSYSLPTTWAEPRVQWAAQPQRAALLIHDMQEYFLNFYDRSAAPIPQVMQNIQALLDMAHMADIPVFYTAQLAQQSPEERGLLTDMWGPGLTAQPDQAALCTAIAPQPGDTVLDKWRYSAFARSPLAQQLKDLGRDQLLICGVYAHIGCLITASDAFMQDIQPFFVADALADFSAAEHQMALDYVARRCGQVLSTAQATQALEPVAVALAPPHETGLGGPSTYAALRTEIATLLEQPETDLNEEDNLLDWGLDSVRIMILSERWNQVGLKASFAQLGENPTLGAWWRLISAQRGAILHSSARITLPAADRVLFKMCKHFAIKVPVVFDETQGQIQFEMGVGRIHSENEGHGLVLHCEAGTEAALNKIQYILGEHLSLMARDKTLALNWQASPVAPRSGGHS